MRILLSILLAMLLLVSFTSCKAQLDKVKIAGLLAGFVLDYVTNNELDLSAVDKLAEELAFSFIDGYGEQIPAKYRAETLVFVKSVIPKLIEDFGLGGLGPEDEDEQLRADMKARVLAEFDEFHRQYRAK